MRRPRRRSDRLFLPCACALVLASCGPTPGEERLEGQDVPPAAAMLSPREAGETLDSQLERLRAELAAGMAGDPERLLTAEAITDGLMEARRPFDWLTAGYDVEARLRQLQAMADRVVAQLRRGASLAEVEEDVETMTLSLTQLRGYLAAGAGGPAPPSLDSLLGQDPLAAARVGRAAQSAAAPTGVENTEAAAEPEEAPPPPPPAQRAGGPLGRPLAPDSLVD